MVRSNGKERGGAMVRAKMPPEEEVSIITIRRGYTSGQGKAARCATGTQAYQSQVAT